MLIRVPDAIHVGLFASTGAGKGVSFLIPQLLAQPGSYVALDPQGSLFEASAAHRRRAFGHRIVRLDSSGVCGPAPDGLNPLDFIDPQAPDCLDQCRDLASMLVVRTGLEPDPHWNDSAERVLTAFIYFVATAEPDPAGRHLLTVRSIVSSRDAYLASVAIMRQSGGLLGQQGDTLTWLADKELNSVLSTVQRQTAWMDSPAVAAALRRSSFDPRELRAGRLSVYVIQSPDRLVTMAPQLRVYLGTMLRVLARGRASERNPVWFLIDETAALGRMQVLEDAVTTMRGYGIRLLLTFQSPGQLQKVYAENAQTVLDNLGTQIFFALRSPDSCEYVSKSIGDTTVVIRSGGTQHGASHPTGGTQPGSASVSNSSSLNISEIGRRWAKPEEIRTLPDALALVFHRNLSVIPVKRLRYYDSPAFRSSLRGRPRPGVTPGLGVAGMLAAAACLLAALLLTFVTDGLLRIEPGPRRAVTAGGGAAAAVRFPSPLEERSRP